MQQRYYDSIGVFLSSDPISADRLGGNFNRFWYANNNPYSYVDPDGRIAESTAIAGDECGAPCSTEAAEGATQPPTSRELAEQRQQQRLAEEGWSVTSFVAANPIPQEVVDPLIAGGSGALVGASFGLIDPRHLGINVDHADQNSTEYLVGDVVGKVSGGAFTGLALARGLAVASSLPKLRWLNQNRYWRFGPGKPAVKGFAPKVPMMRIGPSPWNIDTPAKAWWTHWRL